jgi:hypothetical protein
MREHETARGAAAGLAATLPMSAVMIALHARLPRRERTPLPPAVLTDAALREAGVGPGELGRGRDALVGAGHFLYGAAAGALLPHLARRPTPAEGAVFGAALWCAGYLGWVPLSGLMPPATRQPWRRSALMLAAHLVWGACAAALLRGRRSGP